jgi:hypothetical protein
MLERTVKEVGRFEQHFLPDDSHIFYEPDPAHAYYGEIKESPKAKGGYSYVRDSRFVGVSTPTKALDSSIDGLLHWAAKLDQTGVAALAEQQIEAGCDVGDLAWLCSQPSISAALREAELTWTDVRDRAAQRGTNVHELIFLALAQGTRPPSLEKLSKVERGYGQAAIRWWRDRKPKPLFAEQVTVSREHGFAGRFDLLCEIDGDRVLVDAKTRERGQDRRSDHGQLPGYELANRECGIGESAYQVVLLLMPDGSYREVVCVGTKDDFLAALNAYRRGGALEKRMREAAKTGQTAVTA